MVSSLWSLDVIVAVVGSRDLDNIEARLIILDAYFRLQPSLVISGGAVGIDRLAVRLAGYLNIPTREYLPTQKGWKRYKERDLIIATECDYLLCLRSTTSTTYGSGWTRDQAVKMGKGVESYMIKP